MIPGRIKQLTRFFLSILFLGLTGCPDTPTSTSEKVDKDNPASIIRSPYKGAYPIQVVCTTGMVADLARNIGGNHVEIHPLMGEGVDPHLYKASPGDVNLLARADLILYSGHHLEGKMTEIFERMQRKKPTVAVGEFVKLDPSQRSEDGVVDPHLWFDVSLWSQAADVISKVFQAFDPSHGADYQQRGDAYRKELDRLHDETRRKIASIPEPQRVLVTAHDAFRYFGKAYGLEVRGIQGISTESEAGVREINLLVEFLVRKKIKAVFIESSVSEKNVQALIEGCKAQGHSLRIGGELYSDAMGKEGTPDGTYIGMVRHNVETIVHALK